jgi:anti-sigma B factor antagonist
MHANRCAVRRSSPPAKAEPIRLKVHRNAEFTLIELSGELDVLTADDFVSMARARFEPSRRIAIDLGGVTFMGAAGVTACLAVQREARTADCEVGFANPQGMVARVLQVLDVQAILAGWIAGP